MIKGNKVPKINENIIMKKAIKIIDNKKLGVLIVTRKNGYTCGVIQSKPLDKILQRIPQNQQHLVITKLMRSEKSKMRIGEFNIII